MSRLRIPTHVIRASAAMTSLYDDEKEGSSSITPLGWLGSFKITRYQLSLLTTMTTIICINLMLVYGVYRGGDVASLFYVATTFALEVIVTFSVIQCLRGDCCGPKGCCDEYIE